MGEALQKEREAEPLEIFTAVLIGADAVRAHTTGTTREAYRRLYRTLRSDAAAFTPPPRPAASSTERCLNAVSSLRHRQRAVLALVHVAHLSLADVAFVVGVSHREAGVIAAAATERVVRAVGGPADIDGALRALTAERIRPERVVPPATTAPRAVVRTLLAPVQTTSRGPSRRPIFIAVFLMLLTFAVLPVAAHVSSVRPAPLRPSTVLPGAPAVSHSVVSASRGVPVVRVRRGDTLWAIAEKRLRDPMRWREIFALNEGRTMTRGERFLNADLIRAGWELRLPRDA
ncbi:MAG: hypothetical protein ABR548_09075 [Actinomycetota bacterium]|nr:LysM peptidoglycan-binding domain-containing protein [Actinomycetota bacterium]